MKPGRSSTHLSVGQIFLRSQRIGWLQRYLSLKGIDMGFLIFKYSAATIWSAHQHETGEVEPQLGGSADTAVTMPAVDVGTFTIWKAIGM